MSKPSELAVSGVFAEMLANPRPSAVLPRMGLLLEEFEAMQGRADYVAVRGSMADVRRAAKAGWGVTLARPSTAAVFAFTSRAPRTASFLERSTGLAERTVRASIRELCDVGLLRANASGSVIRPRSQLPELELWAFEVKICHWRRAVFQALQYQAFAHRVAVVMPEAYARPATANEQVFRRFGIGLYTIGEREGRQVLECRIPTSKRAPTTGTYYLHALGQVIQQAPAA